MNILFFDKRNVNDNHYRLQIGFVVLGYGFLAIVLGTLRVGLALVVSRASN